MSRFKIVLKPSCGMIDYCFQRPGLGKEMARSRNDLRVMSVPHISLTLSVMFNCWHWDRLCAGGERR
jgi:hypothetical protein